MVLLEITVAALAAFGLVQAMSGLFAVRRFRRKPAVAPGGRDDPWPAVTILKPLHGDEPMLEEALASFCAQRYPRFQIVFGVQDAADPALAVVRRLRERFPACDIDDVVDGTPHGPNRKIGNLINMFPRARHDVLVIADSDVHVAPDYLERIVAALRVPGTGLVTTLYSGLPARPGLPSALGATQISHVFLPGALLARGLGRQDCLGATMALHRETLLTIGGLHALADHLADDAVLGRLVGAQGLSVGLAATVPATTVPESRLHALFYHELRWARTIQSLVPVGFALSVLQFPIFWAALSVGLSGGEEWAFGLFALSWAARAGIARGIDRALGLPTSAPVWLLPLRDLMSVFVILASYRGGEVRWRGEVLRVDRPRYAPRYAAARYAPAAYPRARYPRTLGEG
ncbi:MAG: bacteriohopanetetrol glucosamine biosynthesis glycosyltransferase HpnI [Acidisphaera sp.]|nr:bacteriohopanetetrol glucosamine biosynthesis glycosyltransferase HpnI [Acidisphaera sp.]